MTTRHPAHRFPAAAAGALGLALVLVALPVGATAIPERETEVVDLLALSPEMEEFIDARVRPGMPRSAKARRLMDALFGPDGLDIVYGNTRTRTAVETFEARSGNCLSFTILFVALARHVGLEAHFKEVGEILSWDRRGDVAVTNRHMYAEIETIEGVKQVDFMPGVEKRYRSVRRIDERRVLAHYYSNVGAEALTANDPDRAMEMFTRALATDDTLAAAWVNRGVAHRRLGELEAAEADYLRALELDPDEISAASNLARLYQITGRNRAARPYLKLVRKHRRQNPFYHFRLGLEAAGRDELVTARRFLKRAVRLLPEDVMFRVELGKVQVRSGRSRRAERSFERALELSTDEAERARLKRLLEQARATAA